METQTARPLALEFLIQWLCGGARQDYISNMHSGDGDAASQENHILGTTSFTHRDSYHAWSIGRLIQIA